MDAIAGTQTETRAPDAPPASLLAIVLDTNPHAWTSTLAPNLPLGACVSTLLVFLNAHLAFSHDNRVALIASHASRSAFLYPSPRSSHKIPPPPPDANKFLPFGQVEATVKTNLERLISSTSEDAIKSGSTTPLAGALSLALSFINKTKLKIATSHGAASSNPDQAAQQARLAMNARILVLSASGDLAAQYIPLMNAMFGAQASNVPIDIFKLAGDSVLLEQASYTTGGVFITPEVKAAAAKTNGVEKANGQVNAADTSPPKPNPQGLLQYLFQAFLPDGAARVHLLPPTSPHVDFRAACFCHRRIVDVGYVCSICLSIFCEELKDLQGLSAWPAEGEGDITCLTCGSHLILGTTGAAKALADADGGEKKKKKKKDKDGKDDGEKKKKKKKDKSGAAEVGTPASGA